MGIQVLSNLVQPEIAFNRVHLLRLEITQPTFQADHFSPRYHVMIEYRLFGSDEQGVRHYHPETVEVEFNDFLQHAMVLAQQGDMTLVSALQSIETAIASIISKEQGMTAQVV
jgi:hypothetical protein